MRTFGQKEDKQFLTTSTSTFLHQILTNTVGNLDKNIKYFRQIQSVILTNPFCNLEKYRLIVAVMPYRSNPCEDSSTKRGKAISCHSVSSISSTLFSKKSTQTQPRLFGSVLSSACSSQTYEKVGTRRTRTGHDF